LCPTGHVDSLARIGWGLAIALIGAIVAPIVAVA
jgi:hypothetical protein